MLHEDSVYFEIENQIKEKSKTRYDHLLLWLIAILIIPLLCFFIVIKPHEYVVDFDNLPEPIQTTTTGWKTIIVNGERIFVDYLAEYDIQGRVLAKKSYSEVLGNNKIVNKLGPRDFVLGWGILGREENMDKLEWYEYGERYVQASVEYENFGWFEENFGSSWSNAGLYYSNNHPVSDNRKIRKLLKHVKVGDVIRIKGYLIYMISEKGWTWGPSSLVRDDHGCEIIYVTDISWLREK